MEITTTNQDLESSSSGIELVNLNDVTGLF